MVTIKLEDLDQRVEKIPEAGCWIWLGALDKDGYAALSGRRVNRIVFRSFNGPLTESDCALHLCDVRSCVNPNHLFRGTQLENVADRCKKGRTRVGSLPGQLNPMAILHDRDIHEIRDLLSYGFSQRYIGELYGVSQSSISYIWSKKKWGHLK